MEIYCRCCGERAKVSERYVRKYLSGCKNQTFVDGGTTNPYASGLKLGYILVRNEETQKFEPLLPEKVKAGPAKAEKVVEPAEPRPRKRRPRAA